MAVIIKPTFIGQILATDTTIFTVPGGATAVITKCTATNDTTTSATLTFHRVETGGSVAVNRLLMNARIIQSKETYLCPEIVGQALNSEDILNAIASAGAQLTVALSVAIFT